MTRFRSLVAVVVVACVFAPPARPAGAGTLVEELELELGRQLENAGRSLVTVVALAEVSPDSALPGGAAGGSGALPLRRTTGCGVVLDSLGFVLTTSSVVEGAVRVDLHPRGGGRFSARVVGVDPVTDLALLRAEGGTWVGAPLGDGDRLQPGSWVTVAGNAYGAGPSAATGIVSRRNALHGKGGERLIQMNVRASPGDMGGAVLNSRGEVVGMVCATLADPRCSSLAVAGGGEPRLAGTSEVWGDTGISFAVVLSSVMPIVRRMQEGGGLERGFLGVEIRDLVALPGDEKAPAVARAREPGVQVVHILPGSPADQAGLRGGDVILQVNGQEVTSSRALRNLVFDSRPGTRLELAVRREGLSMPLVATVGRLRPPRPAAREAGAPGSLSTPVALSGAAEQSERDRAQDLRARIAEMERELSRLARELGRTPAQDIPAEEGR